MRKFILGLIDKSIVWTSAFFRCFAPMACRFEPSCSGYARQAFATLPMYKAFGKTVHRLCRCHPGSSGGYDPIVKDGCTK